MTEPRKRGQPRKFEERPHFDTALEYALHVINDSTVTPRRRDQMAMCVLRCTQQRATAEPTGKQAERKAAASEAAGKFEIPTPPAKSIQ